MQSRFFFRQSPKLAIAALAGGVLGFSRHASADFVSTVQSFTQGTVGFADGKSTYSDSSAALGQPNRLNGVTSLPGPVGPFNPPYEQSELTAVGVGGSITLGLATPVQVSGGGNALQVGIFTSVGVNDPTFSDIPEATARTFAGAEYLAERTAIVEVADTLGNFKSLGRVTFTQPTEAFTNITTSYIIPDSPVNADFDQPFTGTIASFNNSDSGNPLNQGNMDARVFHGSAGGTWLPITPAIAAQIGQINYVRISDPLWAPLDGSALTTQRTSNNDPDGDGPLLPFTKPADIIIDGVNVVVPEPTSLGALGMIGLLAGGRRRGSRTIA